MDRRKFILRSSLVSASLLIERQIGISKGLQVENSITVHPIAISTWDFGLKANEEAWQILSRGGKALDAVEQGIRLIEADADNLSVGIGGLPDRDGIVTLDACIMDENGRAGSVTFLQEIMHPISVARKVMESTPHVMLSGDGALQFAIENGFEKQNLLTDKARKAWEEWLIKSQYKPVVNFENHDTVGLLAIDLQGNLSGGCSTSGLAYKMHGRVGDSPIIGAGLYVDNEVGAAVATGLGEMVMRSLSSFLAVELMRSGATPGEACKEAIIRISEKNPGMKDFQVGIIALNKKGDYGAFSFQPGFTFALMDHTGNRTISSDSLIE